MSNYSYKYTCNYTNIIIHICTHVIIQILFVKYKWIKFYIQLIQLSVS